MNKDLKILLVDDEERNLFILEEILEDHYTLQTASDVNEALQQFDKFRPDLILLDIMMPGGSGVDVCKEIRKDPKNEHVIIMMVSGKSQVEDRLECYEAGANDYITKPFVDDELLAKVKVFARLCAFEKNLLTRTSELEEASEMAQDKLEQHERLIYIGTNTAEIVHNLRNPLSLFSGQITMLERELGKDHKRLQSIKEAGKRIFSFVDSILNATKTGETSDERSEFKKTISSELEILEVHPNTQDIQVEFSAPEELTVAGGKLEFHQIFGNMISNAVDALSGSEQKKIEIKLWKQNDDAMVSISDTGKGMTADVQQKLFEPFFSYKQKEERVLSMGAGLGMSSVQKIVTSLGGTLKLDSEVGQGTTFTLSFPLSSPSKKPSPKADQAA